MDAAMDAPFELLKLPAEIQAVIFSKVESRALLQLAATCKSVHKTINDSKQDERLWKHKLPECCKQYALSSQLTHWLAAKQSNDRAAKPKGMTVGKQTISSYKELACEVGKCVHSCEIDQSQGHTEQAAMWMEVAITKWDTGYILHADIALAHACFLLPTLDKFVKYALLALVELLSLERAAMLLKHAVDFIHDNCILGQLLEGPAAWDSLARANSDAPTAAESNTLATRQIATLLVLITQVYRFSQPRLQEVVEQEKAANFRLQPLPDVFESLLSCNGEQAAASAAEPSHPEEPTGMDEDHSNVAKTPTATHSSSGAHAGGAAGSSPPALAEPFGPDNAAPRPRWRPLPTQPLKFAFLGGAYGSDDLIKAMQLLCDVEQETELCAYSLTPLDGTMQLDVAAISQMFAPGVGDVVARIFTQPADFHKEFTAVHTWQSVARKQAAAAYEVLSPPYMCNRSSVWLAVSSYMTAFFLMRSKSRHQSILFHMEMPGDNSENVLVGCLIELTMELYSLGFLFAACNTSLLAILQNEVSAHPNEGRYELVGQFVDVNVTLLEHHHSHVLKNSQSILRDCVCWALALFRLGEAPLFYHLNPFFVQRLSKVLFCCVLRLPSPQQQQRAAKAAMSLCRLCLQRMCRSIRNQPPELPLPEVNSRSLMKGPGLSYADAGAPTLTKASSPSGHSEEPARPADCMRADAACEQPPASAATVAPTVPSAVPHGVDSSMSDAAEDGSERATPQPVVNAQSSCSSAGMMGEDCVMEGSEQAGAAEGAAAAEGRPGQKLWPSTLPDLVSGTSEQACKSMKWLQKWLAYGESSVRCLDELNDFLQQQDLEQVLDAQIPVPGGAMAPQEKPKSKWGWRWWFLRGSGSGSGGESAATDTGAPPPAPEARPDVTWLGELQSVGREIERKQTWADYDAELTSILGIEGGAEQIFALMPPDNVGQEDFGCPWQTISRLYELLAQVCAALGLNSISALFYSLSVQSVMHLSPSHVLEDQLDPLKPGTAPLTVSRYLSSTLNHLATELITAADYPAALRALVFSRKVCAHELHALRGQGGDANVAGHALQAAARDSDSNEARALLTYATAQLAATILELRTRYAITVYYVEGPVWPQSRQLEGEHATWGPHTAPEMEVTPVHISYDNMQLLTREAALFVLGDMALVTHDLPEAQRILSIVALTAADGQVQHYNLVSQSQSFSAIAGLSLGDACACRRTTMRCMSMFAFDSQNPIHAYSCEDDDMQMAFSAALDTVFGAVDVSAAAGPSAHMRVPAAASGAAAGPPALKASEEAATGPACGHSGSAGSGRAADAVMASAASRCSAPPGAAQDLASDVAGPSSSSPTTVATGASRAQASGSSTSSAASVTGGGGRSGGVALEYEAVTASALEEHNTEDLMMRLTCQTIVRGQQPQQLVDSLQMRALALHMQGCPPEQEEMRMEVFRHQLQQQGQPITFRQAVLAACMDMQELITVASTKAWLQVQLGHIQNIPGMLEYLQQLNAQNLGNFPIPLLAALGLAASAAHDQEPQMAPHAANVWDMIAIAECGGAVPDGGALERFMAPTMPGVQLRPAGAGRSQLDVLKQAASCSLEHVSSLLALQHGVDCELQELSAIAFFMHQISLQVHIMYNNLPAARWALTLLTGRPHDDASHVHTWYWAAAVASHSREWRWARLLFTQAARCTLDYPHMAMRAKALVGVCEAVLAEVVASACPQLQAGQFIAACSEYGQPGPHEAAMCSTSPVELHCQLCRSLSGAMEDASHEFPLGRMAMIRKLLHHALLDAEAAHDPGAELRALLMARVVLQIEGLVTFSEGQLVWDQTARPAWCLGEQGLGPREARLSQRMAHMQRNTFVTRTLLGCSVVVDPVATWKMACAQSS